MRPQPMHSQTLIVSASSIGSRLSGRDTNRLTGVKGPRQKVHTLYIYNRRPERGRRKSHETEPEAVAMARRGVRAVVRGAGLAGTRDLSRGAADREREDDGGRDALH